MDTLRGAFQETSGGRGVGRSRCCRALCFSASWGPNGLHLPKVTAPRAGGTRVGLGLGTPRLQHPEVLNASPASAICLLQLAGDA